jgi:hypothetical protein
MHMPLPKGLVHIGKLKDLRECQLSTTDIVGTNSSLPFLFSFYLRICFANNDTEV